MPFNVYYYEWEKNRSILTLIVFDRICSAIRFSIYRERETERERKTFIFQFILYRYLFFLIQLYLKEPKSY
jgi:hypothetical protein